jgi:hypothetical protein
MRRRSRLDLVAIAMLGLGLLASGDVHAQQKSLKDQLVGTWTFVTSTDDRWGPNAKGVLVFDARGRYVLVINRSDLPKFASNRVDQGTAEENQAVMKGTIATFGTYSLNEDDKTLTTQVEGGSFPNLYGQTQKRVIKALSPEELRYLNPATTTGAAAEVVWKRAR